MIFWIKLSKTTLYHICIFFSVGGAAVAGTNREFTQKLQTVENSRTPSSAASPHYTRTEHTKKQKKKQNNSTPTRLFSMHVLSQLFSSRLFHVAVDWLDLLLRLWMPLPWIPNAIAVAAATVCIHTHPHTHRYQLCWRASCEYPLNT